MTRKASGSALMRDLDHAMTLIEATVNAVRVPVTLKMRLGWDDGSINAPELARRAENAGIKVEILLSRASNCRDMMEAIDALHGFDFASK